MRSRWRTFLLALLMIGVPVGTSLATYHVTQEAIPGVSALPPPPAVGTAPPRRSSPAPNGSARAGSHASSRPNGASKRPSDSFGDGRDRSGATVAPSGPNTGDS